jgi:CRP-like cAMP-binding protein
MMLYNTGMHPLEATPQTVQHLRSSELFGGLDEAALIYILQTGRRRRARANAYLFRQGDAATTLYMLVSGRVKLSQITPEGHQVLLRVATPGETFGSIAVTAQEAPDGPADDRDPRDARHSRDVHYPVTAQAAESCEMLLWEGQAMMQSMERYPRLAINALRVMTRRVQEFQDRYRELATERVERRVARALLRLARQAGRKVAGGVLLDIALTRQDLAEMTGTTRYTVSRMLSEWEARGLVEAGRERVLIKQPHNLVVIAEDLPPHIPVQTDGIHEAAEATPPSTS